MSQLAYGIAVDAPIPLPGLIDGGEGLPRVALEEVSAAEASRRFSGAHDPPAVASARGLGGTLVSERGRAGDHRFEISRSRFHLDPQSATLACALAADDDAGLRGLLDGVLVAAAHLRGREALHAAAVQVGPAAVAICGTQDAGKTSLALALVARGHRLLADDLVTVEAGRDRIAAHAGPAAMTLGADAPAPGPTLAAGDGWRLASAPAPTATPLTLAAVFLLQPHDGPTGASPLPVSPVPLLANFAPGVRTPERRRVRFELASAIAERVPLYALARAGRAPDDIAAVLLEALGEPA